MSFNFPKKFVNVKKDLLVLFDSKTSKLYENIEAKDVLGMTNCTLLLSIFVSAFENG
jgi:hypothetical protein